MAAILRQRKIGYSANAMCVFNVDADKIDAAGEYAASFAEVSHCYKRAKSGNWPYNLYAMVHGHEKSECEAVAQKIAARSGASSYKLLYSISELKKENMIYFSDTARVPAISPRLIAWEMSAACNLKCVHCRACSTMERSENELSTAECFEFLKDIAAMPGKPVLIMSGGEPLIRPDFFEILEYAAALGINKVLATNATMITEEIAARLAACGVSAASVSIDGPDAAEHDKFRRVEGAFAKSLKGIELLKAAGIKIQINISVTRHNYGKIDDIFSLAETLGASSIHIFMLVPTGRAENMKGEEISAAEYERLLNWFYDKKREIGARINLKATCAPHYYRIMRERARADGLEITERNFGMDAKTRGCLAGSGFAFVSACGIVQGCGYMPIAAGNIREKKFSEIYTNSDFFIKLRDLSLLKGKCGKCAYKKVCGGCRARALASNGDCFGEEPYCGYEPEK
ncbi:MAG TPA: radical SAM protein [Candidatus Wallbacteria bacterium]|nr:radical SAM protein [Candidatus Wallbacteria bacterium]